MNVTLIFTITYDCVIAIFMRLNISRDLMHHGQMAHLSFSISASSFSFFLIFSMNGRGSISICDTVERTEREIAAAYKWGILKAECVTA